jgi:hypothetical protein
VFGKNDRFLSELRTTVKKNDFYNSFTHDGSQYSYHFVIVEFHIRTLKQ